MANNSNCVEGNKVESKIPFLHSIPSFPHCSESPSPAETTLNSFSPIFLEFSVYIPTSSHTPLLLTHPQEAFKLGLSQYSTSFVRKALFVFAWLSPSAFCYCLLRIVTCSVTFLFKQELHHYHHSLSPQSVLTTVYPTLSPVSGTQKGFDKCMVAAGGVPQVYNTHIDSSHKLYMGWHYT